MPPVRKVKNSLSSPGQPSLLWVSRFQTDSLPAVNGGIISVLSAKDRLYALDAATGDMLWCHQVGASVYSPLVAENVVVYFHARDGYLYGFDALTGKKVLRTWAALGDDFRPSLAVVDGIIYNATGAGIRARKAANGRQKWKVMKHVMEARGPAVGDGIVFVTFKGDPDDFILALDAATGKELWHYDDVDSWPYWPYYSTVVHGMVYAASSDDVYALDAVAGEMRWRYQTDGPAASSPTVGEGLAYVATRTGRVYALDAISGAFRWDFETDGRVNSSPLVSDGVVYIGAHNGHVYSLDAFSGALLWRYKVPVIVDSTPVVVGVAQGILYFVADRNVHALDATTGERVTP